MSAIIVCDGCGKQAPAEEYSDAYHKPAAWYQRSDKDGIQVACSQHCIETVAARSGKTAAKLPW